MGESDKSKGMFEYRRAEQNRRGASMEYGMHRDPESGAIIQRQSDLVDTQAISVYEPNSNEDRANLLARYVANNTELLEGVIGQYRAGGAKMVRGWLHGTLTQKRNMETAAKFCTDINVTELMLENLARLSKEFRAVYEGIFGNA